MQNRLSNRIIILADVIASDDEEPTVGPLELRAIADGVRALEDELARVLVERDTWQQLATGLPETFM